MKKIICKKEYDTETAEFLGKVTFGTTGDPAGYEECMFKAGTSYFLYVNGGTESKYPKEDIKRMAKDKAEAWLANM